MLTSVSDQYHRHLLAAELNVALNPQLGTAIYTMGSLAGMTVNDILHLAFTTDPNSASLDLIDAVLYLGAGGENDMLEGCRLTTQPPCPTPTPTNTPVPTDTPTNTPTPTNTSTPTATQTPTDTPTPTNTPTDTPTPTNTPTDTPTPTQTPTNTPTSTATPTPLQFQGCTPGYWKQTQHFDSWPAPYTSTTLVKSVFNVSPFLRNGILDLNGNGQDDTLVGALNYRGGSGTRGAAQILLRAAVAALLNAASPDVDYPLTTAQVISQVNAALASNNRDTMLALASTLDSYNNLSCPLN
jgi:hypothetical protein